MVDVPADPGHAELFRASLQPLKLALVMRITSVDRILLLFRLIIVEVCSESFHLASQA